MFIFHVVRHRNASSKYLDVYRHAAALRGMSRATGDMSRRAFLILSICQLKYPSWEIDLFNGALMIAVKLNSASVTSFMYVFVLMCLYYYLGLKGLHRIL